MGSPADFTRIRGLTGVLLQLGYDRGAKNAESLAASCLSHGLCCLDDFRGLESIYDAPCFVALVLYRKNPLWEPGVADVGNPPRGRGPPA